MWQRNVELFKYAWTKAVSLLNDLAEYRTRQAVKNRDRDRHG